MSQRCDLSMALTLSAMGGGAKLVHGVIQLALGLWCASRLGDAAVLY